MDLIVKLRHMGRQYAQGQQARGGGQQKHYLEEAADEIESLRSMYNAQCACTDECAEKYRAEVERKADATLLERVAELEQALAAVNARLAEAQALTPNAIGQRGAACGASAAPTGCASNGTTEKEE